MLGYGLSWSVTHVFLFSVSKITVPGVPQYIPWLLFHLLHSVYQSRYFIRPTMSPQVPHDWCDHQFFLKDFLLCESTGLPTWPREISLFPLLPSSPCKDFSLPCRVRCFDRSTLVIVGKGGRTSLSIHYGGSEGKSTPTMLWRKTGYPPHVSVTHKTGCSRRAHKRHTKGWSRLTLVYL